MRAPFICRPCLARVIESPPVSRRPLCASIHGLALQLDTPPAWPIETEHANVAPDGQQKGLEVQVTGQPNPDTQKKPVARKGQHFFQKDYGNRYHVGKAVGSGPYHRLKTKILKTRGNLMSLVKDFRLVYGLPDSAAREAILQLKRLFRNSSPGQKGQLLDDYQVWKFEYSRLLYQLYAEEAKATPDHAGDWATFSDQENPSVSAMSASWMELDPAKREALWFRMIVSMLDTNVRLLPDFVRATYDESWSQAYVVEDLVRLLLLQAKSRQDKHAQDAVADLVLFLLDSTSPEGSLRLGQDVIGTIISVSPLERTLALFTRLRAANEDPRMPTLLHFASVFAKTKEHKDLAAQILCSMTRIKGFDINSPAASSVCTSLLHLDKGDELPDGPAAPDKLFESLLEHGMRPNLMTMTSLMRNFCVRGYLDTAWTVLDLLLRYNIRPDPHVYSTLLNASKGELDFDSIRRIIAAVDSHKAWNVFIVNDLLDILARDNRTQPERRRRQRKSNSAFRHMILLYAKFFKLEPLQRLCGFPLDEYLLWRGPNHTSGTEITDIAAALAPRNERRLMNPDTTTLTMMLSAFIRGAPRLYPRSRPKKQDRAIRQLVDQLNHFRRLLRAGDPLAVEIVRKHGTLIYDVFLRGMVQFRSCLQPAVRIVRGMLRNAAEEERQNRSSSQHPRPTVHTWTVLVNGFKNHRQPGVAASIVKMMVKQGGVKPNMVTWNALITAFARIHDARGAVKSIRYMEQSGLSPDKHTIQALSAMSPGARKHVIQLMESSRCEPLPQDDVGALLATPSPADAPYPDPVAQQQENKEAPPLSREEFEAELQRLVEEGDALLSEDVESTIEEYQKEDFPFAQSGSIAAQHPRSTDRLRLLLNYRADVEDFVARVRGQTQQGDQHGIPAILNSTKPIGRPIGVPPKTIWEGVRGAWDEASQARDALRNLDLSEAPIAFRQWEEETSARGRLRNHKFPQRQTLFSRAPAHDIPLGVASAKGEARHPRIYTNPYLRTNKDDRS